MNAFKYNIIVVKKGREIMNDLMLIEKKELRDQVADRIEVLNKVKKLFLIPQMEVMTTKQVAEYYEVDIEVIQKCYQRNKKEIDLDGVTTKHLKDFLTGQYVQLENKTKGKVTVRINDNITLEIPSRGIKVFPQRAILRIGMLLRDSEVAKEVRTQLLNTLEEATPEQKTTAIEIEASLQNELLKAVMSGDLEAETQAKTKIIAFQNRHIQQLENDQKILSAEILQWGDREKLNKAVRSIAFLRGVSVGKVWKELYNELLYKHHIGLQYRGRPPYIQHIKENEWPLVQQSLAAICIDHNISITKNLV